MKKLNKQVRTLYPFAALIGQSELQMSLLLHAVNPRLGGIIVRGEKGTAKSTAVRGLAEMLPEIKVVADCAYHCNPYVKDALCENCRRHEAGFKIDTMAMPVVDIPVSATEERVVGSLDFEQTLKTGLRNFQIGLMGEANRGIIYIDEINLLDDHIVDVLLDAAASGINIVEREGVSVIHPAEFILIGTMNPEEGELRPQLLDRFALCAQVYGITDIDDRVEIIKRRESFEKDPVGFREAWQSEQQALRGRISAAKELLPKITFPPQLYDYIGQLCAESFVAGHRADIVLTRASATLAAWRGHQTVTKEDIDDIAPMTLAHRRRQPPTQSQTPKNEEQPEQSTQQNAEDQENHETPPPPPEQNQKEQNASSNNDNNDTDNDNDTDTDTDTDTDSNSKANPSAEVVFAVGKPFSVKRITLIKDRQQRRGSGRRSRTKTNYSAGRYVKSSQRRERDDLAIDATIRAAAPFQKRRKSTEMALVIETNDIREKIREKRIGSFMLFVVDASGSMGAKQRMIETKGTILSLLQDAYQKRDRVGMIAFKGNTAEVVLPPTNSVELAQKYLTQMPVGGRTPLAAGLVRAQEILRQQLRRNPHIRPIVVILSDGKGNVTMSEDKPAVEIKRVALNMREEFDIKYIVIDTEPQGLLAFGKAQELAVYLGGECYTIEQLKTDSLVDIVKAAVS